MISINFLLASSFLILILLIVIFTLLKTINNLKENIKLLTKKKQNYKNLADEASLKNHFLKEKLKDYDEAFKSPEAYIYIAILKNCIVPNRVHYLSFDEDNKIKDFTIIKYKNNMLGVKKRTTISLKKFIYKILNFEKK